MKVIPQALMRLFDECLNAKGIAPEFHGFYRKWLRFYLDFCEKYNTDPQKPDSLPDFINKLRDKNQPEPFQKQAYRSVLIYYDLYAIRPRWLEEQRETNFVAEKVVPYVSGNSLNMAWASAYKKLENEIKVRHYSSKTHKAYRNWVRKFQQFLKIKTPHVLDVEDSKRF